MHTYFAQVLLLVYIAIVIVAVLFLPSGIYRRGGGGYRPQGDARSLDEVFPEQPMRTRHGVVAERKEVMLPQYSLSAARSPHPKMVPHYVFTIICHDVIGEERLQITTEKDGHNVFAEPGRLVEVESRACRLDHHYMVHKITAV